MNVRPSSRPKANEMPVKVAYEIMRTEVFHATDGRILTYMQHLQQRRLYRHRPQDPAGDQA